MQTTTDQLVPPSLPGMYLPRKEDMMKKHLLAASSPHRYPITKPQQQLDTSVTSVTTDLFYLGTEETQQLAEMLETEEDENPEFAKSPQQSSIHQLHHY